jgi:energy-converting hydrogenase Eha subunit C
MKLVWGLCLNQEFGEVLQSDPLGLVIAACLYQAGYIAGNYAVIAVSSISDKQVGFVVAVLALDKNLIFEQNGLLSGV